MIHETVEKIVAMLAESLNEHFDSASVTVKYDIIGHFAQNL